MSSDPKSPKGSFSADISEDAIEEALRAVERLRDDEAEDAVEIVVGEEAAGASPAIEDAPLGLDEASPEEEIPTLQAGPPPLAELEEENRALRDAAARLQSDLESLRRRAQREKEEAERYGVEKLLLALIPVLDNLDRARQHARHGEEGLAEGVEMTQRMFAEALGRFGIESFSAVGETFDPALHEAVELRASAEHPPNVVVEEMVRGYRLHDRLVRPAMVCVAAPPDERGE